MVALGTNSTGTSPTNRGWEEGVGGLQSAIFIVMSMERSAIRTTLGRSRSASVGPQEPVQLQHCTATGRGRAKSGRPPLGLSCAPRAPLGTRNLVRILEYSSDRPTTWNLASGKSPPSFGAHDHGCVRPYSRFFHGASTPHLATPDAATLSATPPLTRLPDRPRAPQHDGTEARSQQAAPPPHPLHRAAAPPRLI